MNDTHTVAKVQENHTRIRRMDLLGAIQKNRNTHKSEYEEAILGWRKKAVKALRKHVKEIEVVIDRMETDIAGEKPVKGLSIRKLYPDIPDRPEDHTKDYDGLIRRLEMSSDDDIFITHADFRRYVLDEWEWKEAHTMAVSNYASPGLDQDFADDYASD